MDQSLEERMNNNNNNNSRRRGRREGQGAPNGNENPLARGGATRNKRRNNRSGPYNRGGRRNRGYDDYEEENSWESERRRNTQARAGNTQIYERRSAGTRKILLSNLDPAIEEEDLKTIFNGVCSIKSAAVNYDRNGQSKGTAEIEFEQDGDAEKAHSEFNEAEVDGRTMYITVVGGVSRGPIVVSRRAAPQQQQQRRGGKRNMFGGDLDREDAYDNRRGGRGNRVRGGRGGARRQQQQRQPRQQRQQGRGNNNNNNNNKPGNKGGRGARKGGNKREKRKEYTAEELDAMMDTYKGQANNNSNGAGDAAANGGETAAADAGMAEGE